MALDNFWEFFNVKLAANGLQQRFHVDPFSGTCHYQVPTNAKEAERFDAILHEWSLIHQK